MEPIEELVLKWRNVFGWEEYIDDTVDEQMLALKMETAAMYIISLPYNNTETMGLNGSRSEKMIETSIFPIICRVIKNGGRIGEISGF